MAIRRLLVEVVSHNHFLCVNQVIKNNIIVGIKIFNIVEDLGFVNYQTHVIGRWRLGWLVLHWPRRQKRLGELLE